MIDIHKIIEFEDIVLMKKRISQRLNLSPEQLRFSWRNDTIEFIEDHFVYELDAYLYAKEFDHAVESEVQKQDDALILQLVEALESVDDAMPFPVAMQVLKVARARLGDKP